MAKYQMIPTNREEMRQRGWDELDFLFITGDAYVDHPSFAHAIITRVLESRGFRVGIVAQPDWKNPDSIALMGKPSLGVLVSAGNLDSMLSNYTAAKKKRKKDRYSPGGEGGKRPDRATIVYCNMARKLWKDVPIIIGGIEASLRRFVHYDYWSDKLRKPILMDSKADLLVWGMGEKTIVQIAQKLQKGIPIAEIRDVRGTCYIFKDLKDLESFVEIPSWEEVQQDKKAFARAYLLTEPELDPLTGRPIVQRVGDRYLVQNPPQFPLSEEELDEIYELPYTRKAHPSYDPLGGVPALEEVQFSITAHRGCFGSCSFCALSAHQGRIIQKRSDRSILKEAELLTRMEGFKGYIHDVGGPTANFHERACKIQDKGSSCKNRQCTWPSCCPKLRKSNDNYMKLLRKVRSIPGVKKVFVRSGIRYDYIMAENNRSFLEELCEHHVSGQLKVAPEHVSARVLNLMRKPPKEVFLEFKKLYEEVNRSLGKKQFLVPYLISSHPGSTLEDAIELAEFLRDIRYHPEQVQDFIPTPGTLSTCMYYSEINPYTGEKIFVAKTAKEKAMQRALLQWRNPKNYKLVKEALLKAGRRDLIGRGKKCLIREDTRDEEKHKKGPTKHKTHPKNKNLDGKKRKKKR